MVRNLVGTLVQIGRSKQPPQWAREVLDSRNRARAGRTFGAAGLYLEAVDYEPHWGLPQPAHNLVELPVLEPAQP
jgi:tRNA pseudouridine38-40 synthase